jgi:glycosyltransferase involved in cell wall biosynthesis
MQEGQKKILIATGIYPPSIGGPAQYAFNLARTLRQMGHTVVVSTYKIENHLPTGIRHLAFFFKLARNIAGVDRIIALDTFSVGLPAVVAGLIFRVKSVVRIGGDFLWEQYVERTHEKVTLDNFYVNKRDFSRKEKLIFKITKWLLKNASRVVFSTQWQKEIWSSAYFLENRSVSIIENYFDLPSESFPNVAHPDPGTKKVFLSPSRNIFLKNVDALKDAFSKAKGVKHEIEIDTKPREHNQLLEDLKRSYAVIVPSFSEVSPNLVMEGLRFGKPFILTKHNGITERVKNCGVFVDPFDEDDIVSKILYMSEEANCRHFKEQILNNTYVHSWEEIGNEFMSL